MPVVINGSTGITYPVVAGGTSALQASAGKVLQVVSATKTDTFSVTGSDFIDVTGLSVSITPSSATSKILMMVHLHLDSTVGGFTNPWRLMRDSTPLCIGDANSSARRATGGGTSYYTTGPLQGTHQAAQFLDSPATTSATTYKIQVATYTNASGTTYVNRGYNDDGTIQQARYASAITVMEIAA
jgi:hypothetical protein